MLPLLRLPRMERSGYSTIAVRKSNLRMISIASSPNSRPYMIKVDIRGIAKVRSKGRTYWYAWRGGPRLRGEPGSPELLQSYNEAIERRCARIDNPHFFFDGFGPIQMRRWLPICIIILYV